MKIYKDQIWTLYHKTVAFDTIGRVLDVMYLGSVAVRVRFPVWAYNHLQLTVALFGQIGGCKNCLPMQFSTVIYIISYRCHIMTITLSG